ncbi:MAG: L-threonylcarbamoyladenylate synthase, partial [Alphaproteobacteria bacterium]
MKIINQFDNNAVEIATDYLNEGKIICFPTDTIYGLAVDATNEKAVEKLYNFKNRPKNKPFSIFIRDINIAKKLFV